MKKYIVTAILASSFLFTGFTGISYSKDSVVGIVDTQKIFQTSKLSESLNLAKKELENLEEDFKKETLNKSKKLEEAREKKASDAELKKMQEQFQKDIENKKREGQEISKKKQDELEEMGKKFKVQVEDAIKEVAKDKQLEVVVDKQAVLFGGTDITDDVIKKLK